MEKQEGNRGCEQRRSEGRSRERSRLVQGKGQRETARVRSHALC